MGGVIVVAIIIFFVIRHNMIKKRRKELLKEVLDALRINNIDLLLRDYDDKVVVKSKQALSNYTDLKYIKDNDCFAKVKTVSGEKERIKSVISAFLKANDFTDRSQYKYIRKKMEWYFQHDTDYKICIEYITSAGNPKGQKVLNMTCSRIKEIDVHPELVMSKSEYNKLLKQQSKEILERKRHTFYNKVNLIIDFANEAKETLIVKEKTKALDELVQQLFDRTVNSIQKVKQIDSDEWELLENYISSIDVQIRKIVEEDSKISKYYASEEFERIKETCALLTQSRREFNEYIDEKAQSISQLFGTRVVRNETQQEDVNNYIRVYKKSITPFTAEVSSNVFGSAENNPITYIVKYFYPNKSQYREQIQKLKILIEELETLKEAKEIINNYKKDYEQYIKEVPNYVLENDEDGFYSRLGLAVIDEAVLNVEYRFTYTSDGGMAQRSFTVPMNEENIIELINSLESKLSMEALAKEQRAMMTSKLRKHIKERDDYTCCQCGNSIRKEPNLLLEIDHIIPVSKGGLTQEDNLQTLCWKCNRSKGSKLMETV